MKLKSFIQRLGNRPEGVIFLQSERKHPPSVCNVRCIVITFLQLASFTSLSGFIRPERAFPELPEESELVALDVCRRSEPPQHHNITTQLPVKTFRFLLHKASAQLPAALDSKLFLILTHLKASSPPGCSRFLRLYLLLNSAKASGKNVGCDITASNLASYLKGS